MIKELIIKNFEAHDKFRVKLDSHITTFTGATDVGKSSIIRAIKWVVLNRPLGDSFIRDKDKPAYVGIKTEKGIVSRKKGKEINIYKINNQILEAFRTNVPEEVQRFLEMEELNFQLQFDAPYWFMISPGEVSKQLNRIVDLEIIDTCLGKLASRIHKIKTEVNVVQERIDKASNSLEQLSFVKPMSKDYNKLEILKTQIESKRHNSSSLSIAIQDIERYIFSAKTLMSAHFEAVKLLDIGTKYKIKANKIESLKSLIRNLSTNTKAIKSKIPNIQSFISIAIKYKKMEEHCIILKRFIEEIELEKEKECQRKKELLLSERKLKKMIGQTCPLCGSKMAIKL